MTGFLSRLLLLVIAATGIALALIGWAGGLIAITTLDRSTIGVLAGLSLLGLSGLIAVLYEPIEIDGESN